MKTKKILLFVGLVIAVTVVMSLFGSNEAEAKPETATVENADEETRADKIDYALTRLKMQIQDNMKDPDSFEMMERVYDERDTGDTVKLALKFRGNNSLGGKVVTSVLANYYVSTNQIEITDQFNN